MLGYVVLVLYLPTESVAHATVHTFILSKTLTLFSAYLNLLDSTSMLSTLLSLSHSVLDLS